jgi:hypothetical protein
MVYRAGCFAGCLLYVMAAGLRWVFMRYIVAYGDFERKKARYILRYDRVGWFCGDFWVLLCRFHRVIRQLLSYLLSFPALRCPYDAIYDAPMMLFSLFSKPSKPKSQPD